MLTFLLSASLALPPLVGPDESCRINFNGVAYVTKEAPVWSERYIQGERIGSVPPGIHPLGSERQLLPGGGFAKPIMKGPFDTPAVRIFMFPASTRASNDEPDIYENGSGERIINLSRHNHGAWVDGRTLIAFAYNERGHTQRSAWIAAFRCDGSSLKLLDIASSPVGGAQEALWVSQVTQGKDTLEIHVRMDRYFEGWITAEGAVRLELRDTRFTRHWQGRIKKEE